MNPLSFCLKNSISHIHFTKIFFQGIEFYVESFSFSTLKMLHHCLLACIVFDEKSSVILFFVPLNVMCVPSSHLTLAAFKIFSFFLVVSNLDVM